MELSYTVGRTGQTIVLRQAVIEHFHKYRQSAFDRPEAGGQLFALIGQAGIEIVEATGPRSTDRRSRFSYSADRKAERAEIADRYREGLHYVGDWHTHPTRFPIPSADDILTIREIYRQSKHGLSAFVLVVVGKDLTANGLHVSLNNDVESVSLRADRTSLPAPR